MHVLEIPACCFNAVLLLYRRVIVIIIMLYCAENFEKLFQIKNIENRQIRCLTYFDPWLKGHLLTPYHPISPLSLAYFNISLYSGDYSL